MGDQRDEGEGIDLSNQIATESNAGLFSGFPKKILPDFLPGFNGPPMDTMLKREDAILLALPKIWDLVKKQMDGTTPKRETGEEIDTPTELLFPPDEFPTHTIGVYGVALDTIQGRQELVAYALQRIFDTMSPEVTNSPKTRGKKRASEEEARAIDADGKRQKKMDTETETYEVTVPEEIFETLKGISKVFAESGQQMLKDPSPKVSAWAVTWRQFVMEQLPGLERDKLCKLMEKQWQDLYLKCSKELPDPKETERPNSEAGKSQPNNRVVKKGTARPITRDSKTQQSDRVSDQKNGIARRNTEDGNSQSIDLDSDHKKKEIRRRNTGDGKGHPSDLLLEQNKKGLARCSAGDGTSQSLDRGLDWKKKEAEVKRSDKSGEGKSKPSDQALDRKKKEAEAKKKLGLQ